MAIKQDMVKVENSQQEDVREPLIQKEGTSQNKQDDYGAEDQTQNSSNRHQWMVYLSTFVAVCGSFEFGSCAGYSSPTQSAIREDLNLSIAEYSLFGSILTFGAMIGAITSGPIADFIGRKGAMRVSSCFCVAGWLAIYFAKGVLPLDIGRLATGYGMGVFSYVVPVFIAEIAPKNLRGALTTINQLMICTGVSVAFIIGTFLTWRTLALTGLVPCAVLLLGLFSIPESPRWLAKKGYQKEFEAALQKLRGTDADISDEAAEIQVHTSKLVICLSSMKILFQMTFWVVSYLTGLHRNSSTATKSQTAGFVSNEILAFSHCFPSDIGTIIYAILQVVITALGTLFIDRAGRKPLLLVSASGVALGCILAGTSFYLKEHEISVKAAPALAVTGILVYIGSFSAGMGAVPWVVMSEIFPINVKGVAGSLATLMNWFGAWAVSYTFNFLMNWSSYGTFVIYAAINALAILFVIKVVPETKGRTLEQIQAAINS